MADLSIRDLDDGVKAAIDDLARQRGLSTAAYVRDVLRRDVERGLRRKAMVEADARISKLRQLLPDQTTTGADVVREVRDAYDAAPESVSTP